MIDRVVARFIGTKHERDVKQIQPLVDAINALAPEYEQLSDAQFLEKTAQLRTQVKDRLGDLPLDDPQYKERCKEALEPALVPAFAMVREAGRRKLGMRHFDVQLIGGIVLHEGKIAEMKTGEGKTLVATLPAVLNALTGRGVHIVTVNDYLARRDAEWMSPIYRALGMTVGVIVHDLSDAERRAAYGADITYGTNNEFGFDYLRDNMKFDLVECVQRGHQFGIVDEVDSILIDEARTPLIISGPAEESTDKYYRIDKIIPKLIQDIDYTVEEKHRTATLTEEGVSKTEKLLGLGNMYDPQHMETIHHVYQALRAHTLYHRDVEYVVKNGEVIIVDEFTGREMPGRRWSDGLHQAVEAKEGVKIERENQTLATITFQNYFRMYKKLSGMTGTAETEATEFNKIYKLDVSLIPTNRPLRRAENPDVVYRTAQEKYFAVADEISRLHGEKQPVLVGTTSIEKSELLSEILKRKGVRHVVLNAKFHEKEAEIVAQAGRLGMVTIATNMAGRGTDILLGGNSEFMARQDLVRKSQARAVSAAAAASRAAVTASSLCCRSALAAFDCSCSSATLTAALALSSSACSFASAETRPPSLVSAVANCASALRFRFSAARTGSLAREASRNAVSAASLAWAAFLAASCASTMRAAAMAPATGLGWNSSGWASSMGATSVGATITRMPILVASNSRSAKSNGSRIQPWDAGRPGRTPPCSAMPDQVMRCMCGIKASSYRFE